MLRRFLKNETVLLISAFAAAVSMFFIPPSPDYFGYIDWAVIALLFCLMTAVQGIKSIGFFDRAAAFFISGAKTSRRLAAILAGLCFFFSMLITNDVALITFVPLTIILFGENPRNLIVVIVLDTIAANLGSMLTPLGNPQNLFIYSYFHFQPADFIAAMLPYSAVSLVLLALSLVFIKDEPLRKRNIDTAEKSLDIPSYISSCLMLLLSLLTVLHVLNYIVCLSSVLVLMLIFDRGLFKKIDYMLLLTFICFFIFVGNIARIEPVKAFLESVVATNEAEAGILLSQIISNVPCAVMLSGFTKNARELLVGVNIGGLGTLVASLASLISFKFYAKAEKADRKSFLIVFTLFNVAFLFALYLLYRLIF